MFTTALTFGNRPHLAEVFEAFNVVFGIVFEVLWNHGKPIESDGLQTIDGVYIWQIFMPSKLTVSDAEDQDPFPTNALLTM